MQGLQTECSTLKLRALLTDIPSGLGSGINRPPACRGRDCFRSAGPRRLSGAQLWPVAPPSAKPGHTQRILPLPLRTVKMKHE